MQPDVWCSAFATLSKDSAVMSKQACTRRFCAVLHLWAQTYEYESRISSSQYLQGSPLQANMSNA